MESSLDSNGFFMPQSLVLDEKIALRYLELIPCPLWIISKESELQRTVLLVSDLAADAALIDLTTNLANRIKRPLTGFIRESEINLLPESSAEITWLPLTDFSPIGIEASINRLGESLLFLSARNFPLVRWLHMNCVFYPNASGA